MLVASAAKAELSALFMITKEERIIWCVLSKVNIIQPSLPIYINNTTTICITKSTTNQQQSHLIVMRYVWLLDRASHIYFKLYYFPDANISVDCYVEKHIGPVYTQIYPYYLHMKMYQLV